MVRHYPFKTGPSHTPYEATRIRMRRRELQPVLRESYPEDITQHIEDILEVIKAMTAHR